MKAGVPRTTSSRGLSLLEAAQAGLQFIAEFRDADHLQGSVLKIFPQGGDGLLHPGRVRGAEDDDGIWEAAGPQPQMASRPISSEENERFSVCGLPFSAGDRLGSGKLRITENSPSNGSPYPGGPSVSETVGYSRRNCADQSLQSPH